MAKKFDGKDINAALEVIGNTRKPHIEATETEKTERKASMKTQGKKGCYACRINMAFTPDNHDYIRTMAKVNGQSTSEFVNAILDDIRGNDTKYKKFKKLLNE